MVVVAVERCESYSHVDQSMKALMDRLGGMSKFVKGGDKVLLKPNTLQGKPVEAAITTHPAVISSVIDLVIEAGGSPYLGDSPAVQSFSSAAAKAGQLQAAKKAKIVEFRKTKRKEGGEFYNHFDLAAEIDDFDVIINLPKLKNHALCSFTGGVKNLFGLIPGLAKGKFHLQLQDPQRFSAMLVDLAQVVKPSLTIMDGIIGMEGQGPGSGDPRRVGILAASADVFALDSLMVDMLKLKNVPSVEIAKSRGLGTGYTIEGDVPTVDDWKPARGRGGGWSIMGLLSPAVLSKPWIIEKKCIACGDCVRVCPTHTISIDRVAKIDYTNCIKCFCCHEVCPERAIRIKKGLWDVLLN